MRGKVIGERRIGLRSASLVACRRTTPRLPVRQIHACPPSALSTGEIIKLTHAVRKERQLQVEALKVAVQASPVVRMMDETG